MSRCLLLLFFPLAFSQTPAMTAGQWVWGGTFPCGSDEITIGVQDGKPAPTYYDHYASIWVQPSYGWVNYNYIAESNLIATDAKQRASGGRLIDISADTFAGGVFYTGVWSYAPGPAYSFFYGRDAASYQTYFNSQTKAGYRPVRVRGYRCGNTVCYTGIFENSTIGSWYASHAQSGSALQAQWDNLTKQGYWLADISETEGGINNPVYTSIWTKAPAGVNWIANWAQSPQQLQAIFDAHKNGYHAKHIHACKMATGAMQYAVILTTEAGITSWGAISGLAPPEFGELWNCEASKGYAPLEIQFYNFPESHWPEGGHF